MNPGVIVAIIIGYILLGFIWIIIVSLNRTTNKNKPYTNLQISSCTFLFPLHMALFVLLDKFVVKKTPTQHSRLSILNNPQTSPLNVQTYWWLHGNPLENTPIENIPIYTRHLEVGLFLPEKDKMAERNRQ